MQRVASTTDFAGWIVHAYNPWLSSSRLLRSVHSADATDAFSSVGDGADVARWNDVAEKRGAKTSVFAGPWCRALTDDVATSTRAEFWKLVKATPAIDWFLLFEGGTRHSIKIPRDWGNGYANCWIGVKLTGPDGVAEQIGALRSVPALRRFAVAAPLIEDLGDIDLHDVGWVMAQTLEGRPVDEEAITGLKLQCMAFGTRFWLEESCSVAGDRFSYREQPAP